MRRNTISTVFLLFLLITIISIFCCQSQKGQKVDKFEDLVHQVITSKKNFLQFDPQNDIATIKFYSLPIFFEVLYKFETSFKTNPPKFPKKEFETTDQWKKREKIEKEKWMNNEKQKIIDNLNQFCPNILKGTTLKTSVMIDSTYFKYNADDKIINLKTEVCHFRHRKNIQEYKYYVGYIKMAAYDEENLIEPYGSPPFNIYDTKYFFHDSKGDRYFTYGFNFNGPFFDPESARKFKIHVKNRNVLADIYFDLKCSDGSIVKKVSKVIFKKKDGSSLLVWNYEKVGKHFFRKRDGSALLAWKNEMDYIDLYKVISELYPKNLGR